MTPVYLTRVARFSAAHRYHRPEWTEAENRRVFGPCGNPYGHGHNYRLEVMVAGEPDRATGFVADLGELDRVLEAEVLRPLDHQHLNHAVPEFAEGQRVPTTENLLVWLWEKIEPRLDGARLVRLRLREDEEVFADYYGPTPSEAPPPLRLA